MCLKNLFLHFILNLFIEVFVMYSFLVEFNPLKTVFSVAKKGLNVQSYQLPIISNSYVSDFRFAIPRGYQSYMNSVCVN